MHAEELEMLAFQVSLQMGQLLVNHLLSTCWIVCCYFCLMKD